MGPYKLHIPGPQSSASLPLHRPDELDKLESEAGQMLRNCSTREVGLVLLFPFENPDTPVELLSQRPEHELDEILQSLPPREHDHTGRCNDDIINLAKARAIVQRLKLDCSTAACMWTPDRESGLDEDQIPTAINRHIFRKEYCNVDFTEVLRAACGLRSQNIENLYACANQLYLWCQDSHPPQRRGIIEKLRSKYSFTHQLVSTSPDQPRHPPDLSDGIVLWFGPIRSLITRQDLPLKSILENLAVLSLRYRESQTREQHQDWSDLLSADFPHETGTENLMGMSSSELSGARGSEAALAIRYSIDSVANSCTTDDSREPLLSQVPVTPRTGKSLSTARLQPAAHIECQECEDRAKISRTRTCFLDSVTAALQRPWTCFTLLGCSAQSLDYELKIDSQGVKMKLDPLRTSWRWAVLQLRSLLPLCGTSTSELQSRILSLQIDARSILSTPSSANNCYIALILTQTPFRERTTPVEILSSWSSCELDDIWKSLPFNNNTTHHTSDIEKAQEIMRRINLEPPKLPLWNQKWSQPGTGSKMTARAIAATIDVAMSAAFYFVPFTEFRSEVCGDSSVIVKDVSNGISNACCELRQLLAEHPELRNVYRAAQKELEHPVSEFVVSTGLSYRSKSPASSDALKFIFRPIQDVFRKTHLSLITRLKYLEALEFRYTEMVYGTDKNRWQSLLKFSFEAKDVDPSKTDWSILAARWQFSERSKNILIHAEQDWTSGGRTDVLWRVRRKQIIDDRERTERLLAEDRLVIRKPRMRRRTKV